jgi:2-oxoglutarate ferredoxin oxidoreductase subunit delta
VSKKTQQEAPPEIEIKVEWCKGCSICVDFCPQDVLAIENGVAVVVDLAACNRCQLCDYRCPDFAITVK